MLTTESFNGNLSRFGVINKDIGSASCSKLQLIYLTYINLFMANKPDGLGRPKRPMSKLRQS